MIIKTCLDIHKQLWYKDNLNVGQAYGPSPRDDCLLDALANKLGIPDRRFITSDESRNINAQQYLMAMLEIMEPLSLMFHEIWRYCTLTMIKTSKNTQFWQNIFDSKQLY